jgi:hypothetical protein
MQKQSIVSHAVFDLQRNALSRRMSQFNDSKIQETILWVSWTVRWRWLRVRVGE